MKDASVSKTHLRCRFRSDDCIDDAVSACSTARTLWDASMRKGSDDAGVVEYDDLSRIEILVGRRLNISQVAMHRRSRYCDAANRALRAC